MRHFIAPALIAALAVTACENDRQPMDGTTARTEQTFLGPISPDYRNTLSAEDFHGAAAVETTKIDTALGTLGFGLAGVPPRGNGGTDPGLPDMDRCDHLRDFTGGFLVPGDLSTAGPQLNSNELTTLTCQQIATVIDASFAGLAVATGAKVRSMAQFGLVDDQCTSPSETPPTTPRAAVGYQFVQRKSGEGLYLTDYNIGEFSSTVEGGGDGSTLALRDETHVRANGDSAGNRALKQELTVATLIHADTSVAEIQKSELLQIVRKNDGQKRTDSLGRISSVTLNYGVNPSFQEDSKFTHIKEDGSTETWQLTTAAQPNGDGKLRLDLKLVSTAGERTLIMYCGPVE